MNMQDETPDGLGVITYQGGCAELQSLEFQPAKVQR